MAWKKHIALYPASSAAIAAFKKGMFRHGEVETRGTVKFPVDKCEFLQV